MLRKKYLQRVHLLVLIPVVAACFLVPRLYHLQVARAAEFIKLAEQQHNKTININPCRGKILDRNNHELAGSILMESAYVAPRLIRPEVVANFAHDVSRALNVPFDQVYRRLSGTREVPLARKLDERHANALKEVRLKWRKQVPLTAIYFVQEGKRVYSRGDLASQLVGYTTIDDTGDNTGLAGIEKIYNDELRGKTERVRVRTNAVQNAMEPVNPDLLYSTFGNTVVLTIDDTIQHAAESAIVGRVQEVNADAGIIVVTRVKTGEVLAMANCPSFNLNDPRAPEFTRRNRSVTDAIEPGSVMKIFTFTSLLDDDKVSLNETVNCEGGRWQVHGRTITDSHSMGSVPVREVFAQSSNVGSVKCGLRLSPQRFYEHLVKFGFGRPTGIDLPGETDGLLRHYRNWSLQSSSSIPMGYELRVSGIQVAAAVSAIVNNGIYMQPHIVKEIRDFRGDLVSRVEPKPLRRVCSSLTSKKMLEMMEGVVTKGTGKTAALTDYRVGGKTGTTKKVDPETRTYTARQYIASFCGVAPLEDPEICIYIWIDNPRGTQFYGGQVSAPVFKDVAEVALKVLKVPVNQDVKPAANMEVALERIRGELEGKVPVAYLSGAPNRDDPVSSDTMPNLSGLTMREVSERLAGLNIPYDYSGSGVVLEQSPAPYLPLERGERAQITFGSKNQFLSSIVVPDGPADGSAAEPPAEVAESTPPATRTDPVGLSLVAPGRDEGVRLAVSEKSVLPAVTLPRPAKAPAATPTPVPDLDDAAHRPLNKAAGNSNWARWEKQSKRTGNDSDTKNRGAAPSSKRERPAESGPAESPASAYDLARERGPNTAPGDATAE